MKDPKAGEIDYKEGVLISAGLSGKGSAASLAKTRSGTAL